ncbi:hypothetical protein EYF80_048042 [Liparis tanakae]|uniref:Uncharacterized protein n=1 Tax=Liparis tanakae TaxID=230148 RepID=A0A4Z2FKM8_9TELE|nr:hypothetical protein EYF80_048042 [Liparis tanakae]
MSSSATGCFRELRLGRTFSQKRSTVSSSAGLRACSRNACSTTSSTSCCRPLTVCSTRRPDTMRINSRNSSPVTSSSTLRASTTKRRRVKPQNRSRTPKLNEHPNTAASFSTHRHILVFTKVELGVNSRVGQFREAAEELGDELCRQALLLRAALYAIQDYLVSEEEEAPSGSRASFS